MPLDTLEKWETFLERVRPMYLDKMTLSTPHDVLIERLNDVVQYASSHKIKLPHDVVDEVEALRTVAYFNRVMRSAVLHLYRGDSDEFGFFETMTSLIRGQYRRAWNEGMRAVELDPKKDMTTEWEAMLQNEIGKADPFIIKLAEDIMKNRDNPDVDVNTFYARVDLWTNRYNEIVALAKLTCGTKKQKLVWRLGRTELHCTTCATLHGVVAYTDEWLRSGYKPQSAPNPLLECGGWRCDCSLVPTRKYKTRGGIPKI